MANAWANEPLASEATFVKTRPQEAQHRGYEAHRLQNWLLAPLERLHWSQQRVLGGAVSKTAAAPRSRESLAARQEYDAD